MSALQPELNVNRQRACVRLVAGLGLMALAACNTLQPVAVSKPEPEPQATVRAPAPRPVAKPVTTAPSARSQDLAAYYARVQAGLLSQGLLRTDGGGVDTPYSATQLLNNFEAIAFYDEYARGAGFSAPGGAANGLRKWVVPIQMEVEFGASVPLEQQSRDRAEVARYASRLQRLTRHPISMGGPANFHVIVAGEDDKAATLARVLEIVPNLGVSARGMLNSMPRSIHCLVMAFSSGPGSSTYNQAIAVIRSEHPDLMRKSCFHEELAQGLGLANDSPHARPSIFNDDDEFALLTTHDEDLLGILYDPRLRPGMNVETARPIIRQIIAGRTAGPS